MFNGSPLAVFTDAYAYLTRFYSPDTNQDIPGVVFTYDNHNGEYTIEGVPVGRFDYGIYVDSGYPFEQLSPGDFDGFWSGENPTLEIGLHMKIVRQNYNVHALIRMKSPVDSLEPHEWRQEAFDLYDTFYWPAADVFEWYPVPGVERYAVSLALWVGDPASEKVEGLLFSKVYYVTESRFRVVEHYGSLLPPTEPNQYYTLEVYAIDAQDQQIGEAEYIYPWGQERGRVAFRVKSHN